MTTGRARHTQQPLVIRRRKSLPDVPESFPVSLWYGVDKLPTRTNFILPMLRSIRGGRKEVYPGATSPRDRK